MTHGRKPLTKLTRRDAATEVAPRSHQSTTRRARSSTAGFTLIEVLVVMVIIAILVGLTVTVVGNAIGSARVAGTKGTITKISGLVQERMRAIDRALKPGGAFDSRVQQKRAQIQAQAGSASVSESLARVVVMKEELKRVFYGMRQPSGLNYPVINYPPVPLSGAADPRLETSKLLYAALTKGAVHGVPPVEPDSFSTNEVRVDTSDTSDTRFPGGRPYFVDAWGEPLRFYLFPTRLVRPGGSGAPNKPLVDLLIAGITTELLNGDPHDPLREFDALLAVSPALPNPPDPNCYFDERCFHTRTTFHVPLIVSGGADRDLGLFEPTQDSDFGHLAQPLPSVDLTAPGDSAVTDNVSSHQRAGGN